MSLEHKRKHAIGIAADAMGELVAFWGFKASTGKIWTHLFLHPHPQTADEIAHATGLSAGSVSIGLHELMKWGVAARQPMPRARKRHYRAETDVWGIVRRVVRERELRLVGRSIDTFGQALSLLNEALEEDPDDALTQYAARRLQGLLELSRIGYRLVEKLADVGRFTLAPIRGALKAMGAGS